VTDNKIARVVLWMVGALLSFSVMAVSIRELSRAGLSIFEILAIRSGVALFVLLALLAVRKDLRVHALPRRMGLNLFRNTVHYASQYSWALSLTMLPLATVFALEFTMPAWTAVLAVWFLHERMTPSRLGVVILGLIGVLVILRPGIASFNPAAILVLLAAFGYAITMITTKQLTKTETTFGIVFWMAVIQLPLSLIGSDPTVFFAFRTPSHFTCNRGRYGGTHIPLLPEQRIPIRRCDSGCAPRLHAYSTDRSSWLGFLRRAT
jgi:drug/metabolite transporter (DMT)-like permease